MELIIFLITASLGQEIESTKAELQETQKALGVVNEQTQKALGAINSDIDTMSAVFLQYTTDTDARLNTMQEEIDNLKPTQ